MDNKIKIKYYKPIINAFDHQGRIYKNSPKIKWQGAVHEKLTGYENFAFLPEVEEFSLYHPKTIERQEKQNQTYSSYIYNK